VAGDIRRSAFVWLLLGVASGLVLMSSLGCSGGDSAENRIAAMNNSNIRRLANLYNAFQLRKGMKGPKDKTEFSNFIQQEMSPIKLERMRVDKNNLDSLFNSERDEQPFVFRYGVPGGLGAAEAVVFEAQGVDGLRQVAFTNGTVEELAADAYDAHLQGKVKPSQSKTSSAGT
jgi:hypothetical protein